MSDNQFIFVPEFVSSLKLRDVVLWKDKEYTLSTKNTDIGTGLVTLEGERLLGGSLYLDSLKPLADTMMVRRKLERLELEEIAPLTTYLIDEDSNQALPVVEVECMGGLFGGQRVHKHKVTLFDAAKERKIVKEIAEGDTIYGVLSTLPEEDVPDTSDLPLSRGEIDQATQIIAQHMAKRFGVKTVEVPPMVKTLMAKHPQLTRALINGRLEDIDLPGIGPAIAVSSPRKKEKVKEVPHDPILQINSEGVPFIDGYAVPFLTATPKKNDAGQEVVEVIVHSDPEYVLDIPDQGAPQVIKMMANAMARAAGFTKHGEGSAPVGSNLFSKKPEDLM